MPILPRKLRPSPQPPRKLRPSASSLPKKPRLFAPCPSGRQRLREPLRLTHFNDHMLNPSNAWKNKPSRGRSKGQLNFPSACQAALQASPSELCSMLVASYHILLEHVPMSLPFGFSQELPPLNKYLPPELLPLLHLSIHLEPNSGITLQTWCMSHLPVGQCTKGTPGGALHSKWQEVMPLHKALTRSCQEAFSQDSHLVRKMRVIL